MVFRGFENSAIEDVVEVGRAGGIALEVIERDIAQPVFGDATGYLLTLFCGVGRWLRRLFCRVSHGSAS